MATKKTNNKAPAKQQKRSTPNISARIDRLVDYENSKVKAIASVNIGGAFAIHGLRVIDSQKGLFVQMPQNSFQKDGKTEYSDIFHPVTADARTELNSKVLEAYEQKLQNLLQTYIYAMIKSLKAVGADKVIIRSYNAISVNPDLLDCDYYRFKELDAGAVNAYQNEYMSQYSWAEFFLD